MGRPSKLTPELTAEIVERVEDGHFLETVAQSFGVRRSTLYEWLSKGDKGQQPYADFADAVRKAQATAELDLGDTALGGDIQGDGQAAAAMKWLERTRGKRFQPKVQMQIAAETDLMLEVCEAVLGREYAAKLFAAMAEVDDEGIPTVLSGRDVDAEPEPATH